MTNDKNIELVIKMSKNVDTIFYFVSYENLMLKADAMRELAESFANKLEYTLYASRCGPEVQNSLTLLEELKEISIEKFEIIYFEKDNDEICLLSHDQKVKFFSLLPTGINSGVIIKNILSEDATTETEFI